jgi:hypothetical protein
MMASNDALLFKQDYERLKEGAQKLYRAFLNAQAMSFAKSQGGIGGAI